MPLARPSARSIGDGARIFLAALVFRLFTAFVAFLANLVFPQYQDQKFNVFRTENLFWDGFARYDAGWYHGIASQGYAYVEGGRSNLAFFPVYPMLMRSGGWLLGGRQEDYYFAGIVVSWLAFCTAMMVLYRLALLDLPGPAALRSLMYAAAFPFAYFFGVVYSESVFFLALVTTAYALRTQRWLLAAVAGAVLTATRVTGVMALPGLMWLAWATTRGDPRAQVKAALALAGAGIGICGYSLYNYTLSGNPFAWFESITYWGYVPGGNPASGMLAVLQALVSRPYQFLTERIAPYDTLNAFAAMGALALVPVIWRRLNPGYALIVLASLVLPLSSGQLEGLGRYTSVQFPIAIALAGFTGEIRHHVVLAAFAMLYALGLAMFVTVHPLF